MAEKLARLERVAEIAPDVLDLWLACIEPAALGHKPGQFVSVRIDDAGDVRRSYSIASHPKRAGLELLVKLVPGGAGSTYFARLRAGDEVRFTGPLGFFVPEARHDGDLVMATTGAGIAAALPILEDVLARTDERGRVILWWGLRREEDVYWQDRLAALAGPRFEARVSLTQAGPGWSGARGRITAHVLDEAPRLAAPTFYLVGHGDMVRELGDGLRALGVDRKRVRREVFYPASKKASEPAAT
jgi:ferredoxin-NADP reductase